MLEYIKEVQKAISGMQYDEFTKHNEKLYACSFAVCQLAELTKKISDDDKKLYSHLPWGHLRALRNRIVHEYDSINKNMLWQIITSDLPALAKDIKKILKDYIY